MGASSITRCQNRLLGNIDCATCDQQGVSGTMFSFNYNGGSGLQLSNTDYSMYVFLERGIVLLFLSSRCVRMERNFCGIEYTACDDTINPSPQSFSVSGSSNTGSQVKRHLRSKFASVVTIKN